MIRIEVIANQAIEEDVIAALTASKIGDCFTYIAPVYGRGRNGRREGSAVWPEENVIFIVYTDEEKKDDFLICLKKIKTDFPDEGLQCFITDNAQRVV